MNSKFYITTSIPYANGEPHLGHAMEFIQADVLARYARAQGLDTVFSTGTDEHGQKVAETAESKGLTPQQLADANSQKFMDLMAGLNVVSDRFIRTTDTNHKQRAQIIWKNLSKDIYKSKYEGWYDVTQEEFVPEGQIDPERTNPAHPKAYRRVEEENYFFALSKYTQPILEAIQSEELRIIPKTKRNEVLALLKEGLEDISISRPKDKLSWGVPVPTDDQHVMYVWFEALMNYITVLGYPEHADFNKYWPANYQIIGKDILRFHGAIWPGMLMSLGLPLQNNLYVHGFVNIDGAKMSKSVGNVIAPLDVVEQYGVDAFRYYFLRKIPSYNDGDFSWSLIDKAYHGELANELGNAVQRTVAMLVKYQAGVIGTMPPVSHDTAVYHQFVKDCKFDKALDEVWDQVKGLNQYIEEQKPWTVAKNGDEDHLRTILAYMAGSLLEIASLIAPFLPDTAQAIKNIFSDGVVKVPNTVLFPRVENPHIQVEQPQAPAPIVTG
ncbi:methionine--tRNA ligase [Candidatus Saccharibacteria bacterium]|nr:methionine--tRNA ligase [Candidatus Saccharibacteria bacterium]